MMLISRALSHNLVSLDGSNLLVLLDVISRLFGDGAQRPLRNRFCHWGHFDNDLGILEGRGTE